MIDTSEQLTIRQLLAKVAEYNASDLHLSVGMPPTLRVDGRLVALQEEELMTPEKLKRLADFFLPDAQRALLDEKKETVASFVFDERARFTVHAYYQRGYITLSLTFIPERIPTMNDLGLPRALMQLIERKSGLILITGPFASGKSTTLAAILNDINTLKALRITTVEKPVEYEITNAKSIVEQREVGRDTRSMTSALTAILDEDVDIVGLSHLDDAESIDLALRCAEGGRLVIATVHSDSIVKVIQQLLNTFPPAEQVQMRQRLGDILIGVLVHRLIPKVGGGRVQATGILVMNHAIRSILKEGEIFQINNILATSREEGMVSIDRSLASLVERGHILRDDALQVAVDPENLKILLR